LIECTGRSSDDRGHVKPGSHSHESSIGGLHVLIVDDEVSQLSALGEILSDEGITTTLASNGGDALGSIEIIRPDVAIVDLVMPRMNGTALLAELRARLPELPVIIATGLPMADPMVEAALELGNTVYVSKPIDVSQLLDMLERLK